MSVSAVLLSLSALACLVVLIDVVKDWAERRAWLKNPDRIIGGRARRRVAQLRQFNRHRTNMMGH
jgi:hypothetical protein